MEVEARLIEACIREDRRAQSELYRRCYPVLMAVCSRYLRNRDDCLASLNYGFLKVLNGLKTWQKGKAPFEPWIRRIMINTLIDEFRKNKRYNDQTLSVEEIPAGLAEAELDLGEADQRMDAEAVEAIIHRLPPVSRQVFNLFAIDGYSHKEIGELLHISEGTSKWHVNFARVRIREELLKTLGKTKTILQ